MNIRKSFIFATAALGVSSVITQVVVLREFMSVFYGNELVIGVVLANWMALTGTGSFLGKFSARVRAKTDFMAGALCLMSVMPVATAFLLNYLRNIIFTPGVMIDFVQLIGVSLCFLAPYCMLSGFSFALFSRVLSEQYKRNLITAVYSFEAAGSVIGGLVFNLVMVYFLKTFQSLLVLMAFNLTAALIVASRHGSKMMRSAVVVMTFILLGSLPFANLDEAAKQYLYKGQGVVVSRDTPYGNVTITKQADQNNFYENNILLFSTDEVENNEESVHYGMVQHPNPGRVLLISGGISGSTHEILKYGVGEIDYLELNPWLIDIAGEYTSALQDKRIRVFSRDARLFVKNSSEHYDAALINVPDPVTAQINRFYTKEFFSELKAVLNKNAVVSIGLLAAADYWSAEALEVSSILYNTLKNSFRNVIIVPGLKNYFIASDSPLSLNITAMISKRGIDNLYVNRYYLDDRIIGERSSDIMNRLDRKAALNTDFTPVTYYSHLRYWLSYFRFNYWFLAIVAGLILLLVAARLNTISLGIFAAGFASTSLEVVLLIAFQVIYGYVYQIAGLIITVFMGGLAAGAFYRRRILPNPGMRSYAGIQLIIGGYSLALPLLLLGLKAVSGHYVFIHAIFFVLTFLIAVMTGIIFSAGAELKKGLISTVASELYGVDLLGASLGALLVTTYLIPLLGIIKVCFVIAFLVLVSGGNSYLHSIKTYPN